MTQEETRGFLYVKLQHMGTEDEVRVYVLQTPYSELYLRPAPELDEFIGKMVVVQLGSIIGNGAPVTSIELAGPA